jgi:hypothetical protein
MKHFTEWSAGVTMLRAAIALGVLQNCVFGGPRWPSPFLVAEFLFAACACPGDVDDVRRFR